MFEKIEGLLTLGSPLKDDILTKKSMKRSRNVGIVANKATVISGEPKKYFDLLCVAGWWPVKDRAGLTGLSRYAISRDLMTEELDTILKELDF